MSTYYEQYIGQKINHWTILSMADDLVSRNGTHKPAYLCRCDCGTERVISAKNVVSGNSKSCGCARPKHLKEPDTKCPICGKPLWVKPYKLKKAEHGICCSRACSNKYRSIWFSGNGNHQFGLKGEQNPTFKSKTLYRKNHKLVEKEIYAPNRIDADKTGRVPEHRLLVEEHWEMFPKEAFDVIDGQHVIKKGYCVHHKDFNHSNNDLSNLVVLTHRAHFAIHNKYHKVLRGADNPYSKEVYQYDTNGTLLHKYVTVTEAAKAIGAKPSVIGSCACGRSKSAYGYLWSYSNSNISELVSANREKGVERKVAQLLDGKTINIYASIASASRAVGLKSGAPIIACIKGKYKSSAGYQWKYADNIQYNELDMTDDRGGGFGHTDI